MTLGHVIEPYKFARSGKAEHFASDLQRVQLSSCFFLSLVKSHYSNLSTVFSGQGFFFCVCVLVFFVPFFES